MGVKLFLIAIFYFLFFISIKAQRVTNISPDDSAQFNPLIRKLEVYFFNSPDSTLHYAESILALASRRGNYFLTNFAYQMAGEAYRGKGDFPQSLEMQLNALQLNRKNRDRRGEAFTFSFIGFIYLQVGNYRQAIEYLLPAKEVLDSTRDWIQSSFSSSNAAYCYTMLDIRDSANYFNTESRRLMDSTDSWEPRKMALRTLINDRFGSESEREGKLDKAAYYYRQTLYYALQDSIGINISRGQKNLAHIFMLQNKDDSAIIYARNAMQYSQSDRQALITIDAASVLSTIYRNRRNSDSALYYQTIAMNLKDSVYGLEKFRKLQLLMLDEQERQQKQAVEEAELRNRLRLSLVVVIAVAFMVVALILYSNNRSKQVINRQLEVQKADLEKTLKDLRLTQAQLIQSEKMASLGQLTAGIAHEIQNPLNFVNNFSEVSTELVDEIEEALQKGNKEEAIVISADIKDNLQKILHHGKRADSIVKGMLQHSRASSGKKELTDINALVDECIRLSFHGMRAKDKGFNAAINTDLDDSIGKVNIVPQDISRVLLNLLNNAFYAVHEKKKSPQPAKGSKEYEPTIWVSTRHTCSPSGAGSIEIHVQDNGSGIPSNITDKIFQPFFTTKPTGQGTGLGLSLSYDIVKAHGGEIKVESEEGEGTKFTIQLPERV